MTPEEMIIFLKGILANKNMDLTKPIVWGQSIERATPFDPDDFDIVDGQLFLNTYEGL